MKKILLGLGSIVAVSAPVIVAVSCGDESTTVITKTSQDGKVSFELSNGVVTSIVINGQGLDDKLALADKIEAAASEQHITLPSGDHEGEIFGLINFDESTNINPATNAEYFAENPTHFHRTTSTGHGTNPGTTTQKTAINIDESHTISVDLGVDTPTELRTKFEQFRTMYNADAAKFLVKVTMEDDSVIQMVFIMKPGTTRANSFMTDTDSYGLFDITLGVENTQWTLNYGDSHAFDFFEIAEPAWIAKINSESTTDQDVTQFDWTLDHP